MSGAISPDVSSLGAPGNVAFADWRGVLRFRGGTELMHITSQKKLLGTALPWANYSELKRGHPQSYNFCWEYTKIGLDSGFVTMLVCPDSHSLGLQIARVASVDIPYAPKQA